MQSPPVSQQLLYRLFGWSLGPAHREWVVQDVKSKGWSLRQGLPNALFYGGVLAVLFLISGTDPRRLLFPVFAVLVLQVFLRNPLKERALRQQGLDLDGNPAASWYDDDDARRKRNISGVVVLAVIIAIGAALVLT